MEAIMPELAVKPETARFSQSEEQALSEALRRYSRFNRNTSLSLPNQIMLNREGRIQGHLRLTTVALKQLCSMLAPGLSLYVSNLVGLYGKNQGEADFNLAIKTINDTIRNRFRSHLSDKIMVANRDTGTVDGFIGPRYMQLSNDEFYRRSRKFITQSAQKYRFSEATLSGRRLMLQYVEVEPLFQLQLQGQPVDNFHGGFHFSNSEVGECAVRIAPVLYRGFGGTGAIGTFTEGGRIAHVGPEKFDERFEHLLDRVRKRSQAADALKEYVIGLVSTRAEFGGSHETHKRRCKQLVQKLARHGMPRFLAKRVISRTLACPAYSNQKMSEWKPTPASIGEYERRTLFDLYVAITYESKRLPTALREKVEQIAYLLLIGRIST